MNARLRMAMMGLPAFLLLAGMAAAADVTGAWTGKITSSGGDKYDLTFNLKQDGGKVTGSIAGGPPRGEEQSIVEGKIEGERITLKVNTDGPGGTIPINYTGKVNGNQIEGEAAPPGLEPNRFVVSKAVVVTKAGGATKMPAVLDVSGVWMGPITPEPGLQHDMTFKLKQAGGKVTGSVIGVPPEGEEAPIAEGTVAADHLTVKVVTENPDGSGNTAYVFVGKVNGNQIEFVVTDPRAGPPDHPTPPGGRKIPFTVSKK
jgi:hypothetical protein